MRTAYDLIGLQPVLQRYLQDLEALISDDAGLKFTVAPATVAVSPTAAAWTRTVRIELQNSAGVLQTWFNKAIATGNSIADTSSAGTASIVSTTLTFTDGVATVVVSGDAEAWLGGTKQVRTITSTKGTGIRQVETITCTAGESTGAGNITMTVTAAGMSNSPKDVVVAVGLADSTSDVGLALRTALGVDADVISFFTVSGSTTAAILTAITPAANDATLAYSFVDTDTTGVTFGASTDTTAGVAPAAGDITMTVTAAGMSNTPKDVVVAIGATSYDASDVAALVKTALEDDTDVGAFFTVSGTGGIVILTAITAAADDATLDNTFVDTDTTGVTFGASVDTQVGVAKETDTLTIAQLTLMGYTVAAKTSVQTFE